MPSQIRLPSSSVYQSEALRLDCKALENRFISVHRARSAIILISLLHLLTAATRVSKKNLRSLLPSREMHLITVHMRLSVLVSLFHGAGVLRSRFLQSSPRFDGCFHASRP
ncbi:hypothetical protein IQ06DRAFT_129283 [Phaeosphaeriaceae sp. SRC1lsM3a]|nr:hypothetical protein IQ06DRAFT_129283 [Stagonospora sp. SRC1lsM3a]